MKKSECAAHRTTPADCHLERSEVPANEVERPRVTLHYLRFRKAFPPPARHGGANDRALLDCKVRKFTPALNDMGRA